MANLFFKTFWAYFIICFIAILPITAQETSHIEQTTGKVQLNALRLNDAPILGLVVVIEGNNLKKEVRLSYEVDDEANLIELPVGIYRVTNRKRFYDYNFVRSPFRVQAGTTTKINVLPPFRVLEQMLVIDEKGARDEYNFAPEPKYNSFRIPQSQSAALKLLIRYDKKQFSSDTIIFTGESVMASYDAFSVYANELRFNRRKLEIEAQGDVIVEDGSQRKRSKFAKIIFEAGKPKIQLVEAAPNKSLHRSAKQRPS